MRQDAAQRFERVGGRELFDRGTAEQDRPIAAHLERPSVDADQRVPAVAGALLDRLQQEGAAGAEPQGCGDGGQRVGRQLEAVDRREGRNCGGHRFGIRENDNASILEGRRRLPRCHPDSNRCRSALRTHGPDSPMRWPSITEASRRRLAARSRCTRLGTRARHSFGARLAGPFALVVPRRLAPSRLAVVAVRRVLVPVNAV